jgi:maltose/moltooligosaccharide transporter
VKPLNLVKILIYSAANMGANLVYAFANFAFPLFLSAYPVSNVVVGFLAQERSLVGGFVQPLVGIVSDHMPSNPLGRRRPFFLIGVPLTALSLLFLSAHPPVWAVLAVMTVFSFFLAVAYDPYLALMPDIAPQEQRGRVGGVMALFSMLGAISVIVLSFALWQEHQQMVFWLVAGGLLACFAVTFFGITEPLMPSATSEPVPRWNLRAELRDVMGRRELVKYLACTFFFWLGNGGVTPFVTRFGVDVLGVEENVSFLLVLPAILGAALFAIPAGLLTERYGKKRVLAVGLCLFGVFALVGALLVRGIPDALLLMSAIGVANAITSALIFPLLTDMIPRSRAGEFAGIGSFVGSIAQPIGALAAGATADVTGSMRGAFSAGGVAMLIAFALLLTVRDPATSNQ